MCTNLSVLGQFLEVSIFIFPSVFHPGVSDLQFWLVLGVIFNFSFFSQLRMMRARTWFKISGRLLVPKKSTHFHLDHLCTFVWLVVSMSAQSVGGDEISVFSPVGMARAAAIPVGALEAGDLMEKL